MGGAFAVAPCVALRRAAVIGGVDKCPDQNPPVATHVVTREVAMVRYATGPGSDGQFAPPYAVAEISPSVLQYHDVGHG